MIRSSLTSWAATARRRLGGARHTRGQAAARRPSRGRPEGLAHHPLSSTPARGCAVVGRRAEARQALVEGGRVDVHAVLERLVAEDDGGSAPRRQLAGRSAAGVTSADESAISAALRGVERASSGVHPLHPDRQGGARLTARAGLDLDAVCGHLAHPALHRDRVDAGVAAERARSPGPGRPRRGACRARRRARASRGLLPPGALDRRARHPGGCSSACARAFFSAAEAAGSISTSDAFRATGSAATSTTSTPARPRAASRARLGGLGCRPPRRRPGLAERVERRGDRGPRRRRGASGCRHRAPRAAPTLALAVGHHERLTCGGRPLAARLRRAPALGLLAAHVVPGAARPPPPTRRPPPRRARARRCARAPWPVWRRPSPAGCPPGPASVALKRVEVDRPRPPPGSSCSSDSARAGGRPGRAPGRRDLHAGGVLALRDGGRQAPEQDRQRRGRRR